MSSELRQKIVEAYSYDWLPYSKMPTEDDWLGIVDTIMPTVEFLVSESYERGRDDAAWDNHEAEGFN